MHATTVGVDLAKTRFEIAVADQQFRIQRRERLTRNQFCRFFANCPPSLIVMEACGSAHYWARTLSSSGHEVQLLPPQYVRAYVRRNKTDAADAAALIEAARCAAIRCVPVKTVDQQLVQQFHRLRTQWMTTRTARINYLRGCLREFGINFPLGAVRGLLAVREALRTGDNGFPDALRPWVLETLEEIAGLERRIKAVEDQLEDVLREDVVMWNLRRIPGIGLLSATALRVAVIDVHRFPTGRHLASWIGLTARECSSGERRRLGRISKRGDPYLRTLMIHGARAVLVSAQRTAKAGLPRDRLRQWALQTQARCGHNKATVALANKLARIVWATWYHDRRFDVNWSSSPKVTATAT